MLVAPADLNTAQTNSVVAQYSTLTSTANVAISVFIRARDGGVVIATEDPQTQAIIPTNAFRTDVTIKIKFENDLSTAQLAILKNAIDKVPDSLVSSAMRYFEATDSNDSSAYNGAFEKLVTVKIPFKDDNHDGKVDAPRCCGENISSFAEGFDLVTGPLKLFRFDENDNTFKLVNDGGFNEVDLANNVVEAEVNKFGYFIIGSIEPSADLNKINIYPNPVKLNIHPSGVIIDNLTAQAKLDLGLAIQNLGAKIKFIEQGDPLPTTIKLGSQYNISKNLKTGFDLAYPNDSDLYLSIGSEYYLISTEKIAFPIRIGYRTGLETGGLSGLGTGFGIIYTNTIGLDFAWTPAGNLGNSIKFGFRILF